MFVEMADFHGRGNLKIFLARSIKIKRTVLVTTHTALSPFLFLSWLGFLALHTQSFCPFSNLNFEQTVQCSERFEIDLLSVEFFPNPQNPKSFEMDRMSVEFFPNPQNPKHFEMDLPPGEFFPNPQNPADLESPTLSGKVCKLPLYKVVASNLFLQSYFDSKMSKIYIDINAALTLIFY